MSSSFQHLLRAAGKPDHARFFFTRFGEHSKCFGALLEGEILDCLAQSQSIRALTVVFRVSPRHW